MKLKIISDGTPEGTKVVNEDGEEIENVQSVSWSIDYANLAAATIKLSQIPVEIEAYLKEN